MTGPSVNVDPFRRPVHEVAALLPDKPSVDGVLEDLRNADMDVSGVRILHGEEGADILDPTGAEHGGAARIVRFFQNLGYTQNILAVYEEGLRQQGALISIPCPADRRYEIRKLLLARGGHAIIYFGPWTAETLTPP
jgi:hypothetical protein